MKQLPILVILALVAAPVFAQSQAFDAVRATDGPETPEGPQVLHVSDWLAQQPSAKAALDAFHAAKAAGWQPPVNKSTAAIGDTSTFKVVNIALSRFEDRRFKLMAEGDRFLLWVELEELDNGNVDQATVDVVAAAMGDATPPGSFNENAGVIVNDEAIFGVPPNSDGDGKSDVLLVDVRDSYNPDVGNFLFVAGFVTPNDLPGGGGNNRDVLYLDTFPSLEVFDVDFVAQTAAHEYQHLIHFNYDRTENSFINEGLSEWAEAVNGYPGRRIDYLTDEVRYNVALFRFNDTGALDDRQRGYRFINYFADVYGIEAAGSITQQSGSGSAGLQSALDGLGQNKQLDAVITDFHLANLINDTAVDPRFGFTTTQHVNVRTVATTSFDGRTDPEMPTTETQVRAGAAQFFEWTNVEDLSVSLTPGGTGESSLELRAITFNDGDIDVRGFNAGTSNFPGTFDRVVVAAIHTDPEAGNRADIEISATWNIENQFVEDQVVYDNGVIGRTDGTLLAFRLCRTGPTQHDPDLCNSTRFANLFPVPDGATLASVSIGAFFDHDFAQQIASDDDPRDFALKVWAADGELIGSSTVRRPGTELFSLDVTDTRAGSLGSNDRVIYLDVDLSDHAAVLSTLSDSVYVGITNTGSDENFLVMGASDFAGTPGNTAAENAVSFLFREDFGGWAAFHELTSGGDAILQERVHPIRATFLTPVVTDIEDGPEVPTTITLAQNYPNPFNPATTITYALPQAGPVHLAVYDVLGREVAVLFDGTRAPGTYTVQVDARTWTSGVYFYVLDAAGQRQARRMLLVK